MRSRGKSINFAGAGSQSRYHRGMNFASGSGFYPEISSFSNFDQVTDSELYKPLPDDWIIGVADVVESTGAIESGLYKSINTIGAAIISAQMNIPGNEEFPFVFGGDGATFAIWPERRKLAADALSAVKRWTLEEFNMGLRVALVPIIDIRKAGLDVAVARFRASKGVDYAMFRGGGVSWADAQMKRENYQLDMALPGIVPNLDGLSCRWTPLVPKRGLVLSVLVIPIEEPPAPDYQDVIHQLLELVHSLERDGHPVPVEGPMTSWQPEGVTLEAHASRGRQGYLRRLIELRIRTFIAWLFFLTNTNSGEFNPNRYRRQTSANSDFRKYDDGLKMTLDCDHDTALAIEYLLEAADRKGILSYGTFRQSEAMMTCIVPSITTNTHVHFIDGASGGYASASIMLKKSLKDKQTL